MICVQEFLDSLNTAFPKCVLQTLAVWGTGYGELLKASVIFQPYRSGSILTTVWGLRRGKQGQVVSLSLLVKSRVTNTWITLTQYFPPQWLQVAKYAHICLQDPPGS